MIRKSLSVLITISLFIIMLTVVQTVFADSVSITSSGSKVTYGAGVTINGAISPVTAGQTIVLQRSINNGSSYSTLLTGTNDGAGQYSFTFTPEKTALYRVNWKEVGINSSETRITVIPKMSIKRPRKSWVGQQIKIYGRFKPYIDKRTVYLQKYVKHRWKNIMKAKSDKKGGYKFFTTIDQEGTFIFRVNYAGEALFYKATTKKFKITSKWRNTLKVSAKYKHFIVVKKSNYKLYYLQYGKIIQSWNTGVGMPSYPTPNGTFTVTAKRYRPTWYNPHSDWSKDMPHSIPWPSSPLGERALNLSASGIRIHGTTQPWLLDRPYRAISHGCIRLKNPNVIWLYNRVPVGTFVKIYQG